jgi:uncharacterized cupredoxin-like copper-binding protein
MKRKGTNMLNQKSFYLVVLFALSGAVHGDAGHSQGSKIGAPADAANAMRTIDIEMTDNRYDRMHIDVREGEVVRFTVHNKGQLVHEFNIGTHAMHVAHQDEMLAMMQSGQMSPTKVMHGHGGMMGHDDPNSVLLNPGETKEIVWKFSAVSDKLEFACNVPGHYQAGMAGKFRVQVN